MTWRSWPTTPRPRIGGDTDDGSVAALFEIDASLSNCEDIMLTRLYFVGEDSTGKDAPSALRVLVDRGHRVNRSGMDECTIERSEMNSSGASGRAAISIETGRSSTSPLSAFTISDCTIYASDRGGIEYTVGDTTGGPAQPIYNVRDTSILLAGSDSAEFGIRYVVDSGDDASFRIALQNVDIDGTASSGDFTYGIDYDLVAGGGNAARIIGSNSYIRECTVAGCSDSGIRFSVEQLSGSDTGNLTLTDVSRNRIETCGAAAIELDFNAPAVPDSDKASYINTPLVNNILVDCKYGVHYSDFDENSTPQFDHTNNTIADNTSYGYFFEGSIGIAGDGPQPQYIVNTIVYGNNSGGDQYDMTQDWSPDVDTDILHCAWQGLFTASLCDDDPTSDENIVCDPDFVDALNGDYHLSSTSPCIDAGDGSGASLPAVDFDGDDREIDGDGVGGDEPDIGADEYDPSA